MTKDDLGIGKASEIQNLIDFVRKF